MSHRSPSACRAAACWAVDTLLILAVFAPLFGALLTAKVYAQESRDLERRITSTEIAAARDDERIRAVIGRIDSIDKTLWWLIWIIFGSTTVSGVVAGDRVIYRVRSLKANDRGG